MRLFIGLPGPFAVSFAPRGRRRRARTVHHVHTVYVERPPRTETRWVIPPPPPPPSAEQEREWNEQVAAAMRAAKQAAIEREAMISAACAESGIGNQVDGPLDPAEVNRRLSAALAITEKLPR